MEMLIIWLKALHITAMLVWSAGLFYLPGLFAAHPMVRDKDQMLRLRAMTRFSFIAVTSPAAVVAVITGTALIYVTGEHGGWLVLKLTAVSLMMLYHVSLGAILARLHEQPCMVGGRVHLSLIAFPAILVPLVLWLVLGKPL